MAEEWTWFAAFVHLVNTYAEAMVDSRDSVVGRVGVLLRVLSDLEPEGASTSDIARAAQIVRPTVHRLLSALAEEGLVEREKHSGRWHLGPELYVLGNAAAVRYDVTDQVRETVHELAELSGESAFFSMRRGSETVCLVREDGAFPLRSHVLYEGIRFPLGVASAGLAILSHLSDAEITEHVAKARLHETYGPEHADAAIWKRVQVTRREGFATNPGLIVGGSWGMAAAVFDAHGSPRWALSLTGVESRFDRKRRPELGQLLLKHAHALSLAVQAR